MRLFFSYFSLVLGFLTPLQGGEISSIAAELWVNSSGRFDNFALEVDNLGTSRVMSNANIGAVPDYTDQLDTGLDVFSIGDHTEGLSYNHQLLSREDGLSARAVLCGLQDQRGFLWFGTRNGLNRFDGDKFILLTKQDGLQENRVVGIVEDREGNIWISYGNKEGTNETDGRTDIYNPINGEIVPMEEKFPDTPFELQEIQRILSNKQRDIYFLVRPTMLYKYSLEKGFTMVTDTMLQYDQTMQFWNFTPHAHEESIALTDQYSFYGNRTVINDAPQNKISYFNEEGLLEYASADHENKETRLIIEKVHPDGRITTDSEACDSLTYSVLNSPYSFGRRWNDKYGPSILLPSYSGLYLFKDHRVTALPLGAFSPKDFSLNLSFFSDRQGNYWVCAPTGLHKFSPKINRFKVLF